MFLMVAHMDFEEGLIHMHVGDNMELCRLPTRARGTELAATCGRSHPISPSPPWPVPSAQCASTKPCRCTKKPSESQKACGAHHGSLGQHLLNFGISRARAGDYGRAESLLTRALSVMETVGLAAADPSSASVGISRLAQGREGALPPPPPPLPASLDSNEGQKETRWHLPKLTRGKGEGRRRAVRPAALDHLPTFVYIL